MSSTLIAEMEVGDSYFNAMGQNILDGDRYDASHVRRPLRGIQFKKDTYATISVWKDSSESYWEQSGEVSAEWDYRTGGKYGGSSRLKNSSMKEDVNFTTNFLLQSVSETRTEKFQPMPTFGNAYGFFFGEQPRMVTYSAVLLNTADFQWEIEWWDNYENYLRGTKLVERGERAYIYYDDRVVEGYLLNAMTVKNANDPRAVMVNFTMFVTNVIYSITPGDTEFPYDGDDASPQASVFASSTLSVRQANLKALSEKETGFLSGIRNAINAVSNAYDNTIGAALDGMSHRLEQAVDWLYGRNILVPAGFEMPAEVTFAKGSGTVPDGTFEYVRVAAPSSATTVFATKRGHFYDNKDEYIESSYGGSHLSQEDVEKSYADFWKSDLTIYDSAAKEAALAAAEARVESIFKDEGVGYGGGDIIRAMGSALFLAVSVAANRTAAGQTASEAQLVNLSSDGTVGFGPAGGTEAARKDQEQAAAEADGW